MLSDNEYKARIEKILPWMRSRGVDLAALEDTEGQRNQGVRYLTGMPGDAVVFLTAQGRVILVPWDENLAAEMARADEIIPYNSFKRRFLLALEDIAAREKLRNPVVELSSVTPYPVFQKLSGSFDGTLHCREDGIDAQIEYARAVKSAEEIAVIRKACGITNAILDSLEQEIGKGNLVTEMDVALFIEKQARALGCTGTAFETIAAGSGRSWAIHAYPSYGSGRFTESGPAIIDFGVGFEGYVTDVTLTCVFGKSPPEVLAMIDTVRGAADLACSLIKPGENGYEVSRRVDEYIQERAGFMPHALGHGFGLEAHENPVFRNREDSAFEIRQGMVLAVEPGLYKKNLGGVRLENDLLVTETGVEILTSSRILFFPDH